MNVNTERMLKKDEERGKLITFIFNAIWNARQSPDDNESDAAMTLYTVIRSYDGLQQEAHERKSADIFGLVTDLRKTENASFVTALHLTNAVNKLETVNKAYDEFVAKRAKDRTAAAELPPARVDTERLHLWHRTCRKGADYEDGSRDESAYPRDRGSLSPQFGGEKGQSEERSQSAEGS